MKVRHFKYLIAGVMVGMYLRQCINPADLLVALAKEDKKAKKGRK
jgi:hypothetical protein